MHKVIQHAHYILLLATKWLITTVECLCIFACLLYYNIQFSQLILMFALLTFSPCSSTQSQWVCLHMYFLTHKSIKSLHGCAISSSGSGFTLLLCLATRLLSNFDVSASGHYFLFLIYYRTLLTIIHCIVIVHFQWIVRICGNFHIWFCCVSDWYWMCMCIMTCFCMGAVSILLWFLLKMSYMSYGVSFCLWIAGPSSTAQLRWVLPSHVSCSWLSAI